MNGRPLPGDTTGAIVRLDVAAERVRGLVVRADGRVVLAEEWYTHPERGPHSVVDTVLDHAADLVAEAKRAGCPATAVGVAVHGAVDSEAGVVEHATTLGWHGTPLGPWLAEHVGLPVVATGDVRAAAVAESRLGAGRGRERCAVLSVGTTVDVAELRSGLPVGSPRCGGPGRRVATHREQEYEQTRCGCPKTLASAEAFAAFCAERYEAAARTCGQYGPGAWLTGSSGRRAVAALADALVPLAGRVDRLVVGGPAPLMRYALPGPLGTALGERLSPGTLPDLVPARWGRPAIALGAALLARVRPLPDHAA